LTIYIAPSGGAQQGVSFLICLHLFFAKFTAKISTILLNNSNMAVSPMVNPVVSFSLYPNFILLVLMQLHVVLNVK